jgi:hypothetical protein
MSLKTPDAIRTLQRKLYDKAKTEPGFRFYILYDKVWRADILHHAYRPRLRRDKPGTCQRRRAGWTGRHSNRSKRWGWRTG